MKYLKKFESFINDDNRGEDTQYPELNVALKGEVVEYVDSLLNSNDYHSLVELLGLELPKDIGGEDLDKFFDEVREKAIAYFMKNPEEVQEVGFSINRFKVGGGDGVPRTNNIGGVSESNRPVSEIFSKRTFVEVTDDELAYFEDEGPLLHLIHDEKVTLYDNQIWYNKNDKETIDVLDVYFEL